MEAKRKEMDGALVPVAKKSKNEVAVYHKAAGQLVEMVSER